MNTDLLANQANVPDPPALSNRDVRLRRAVVFAAVFAIDQLAKGLAHLAGNGPALEPVKNTEYALGVVGAHPVVLIGGTLVVVAVVVVWSKRRSAIGPWWILPLFVAGAVSNVADRIALGGVRDFLVTPWFVFNLADVAIVVAIGAFYCSALLRRPNLLPERG